MDVDYNSIVPNRFAFDRLRVDTVRRNLSILQYLQTSFCFSLYLEEGSRSDGLTPLVVTLQFKG
jgi:hypothetical protein